MKYFVSNFFSSPEPKWQTPNMKNWCLLELFQIPNPHSNKTCSCKNSIWRFTFIELMSLILSDVCFPMQSAIFVRKTVFWKTVRALLGLYTTIGSSFRENLLLQTSFLFWFMFLILFVFEGAPCTSSCKIFCCLFACCLSSTRVASTKCVHKLLPVWCLRVLASTFAFVTLHYLDFSTLHSCRPGCFPRVERLSGSVKYCLDFEHLQNDTSKGCAWYCGARLS